MDIRVYKREVKTILDCLDSVSEVIIPEGTCIYMIYDQEMRSQYVGISWDVCGRIQQHIFQEDALGIEIKNNFPNSLGWTVKFEGLPENITGMPEAEYWMRTREGELITKLNPIINRCL